MKKRKTYLFRLWAEKPHPSTIVILYKMTSEEAEGYVNNIIKDTEHPTLKKYARLAFERKSYFTFNFGVVGIAEFTELDRKMFRKLRRSIDVVKKERKES